jgi:hypothetical protein
MSHVTVPPLFVPRSGDGWRDPWPMYARLREEDPVHHVADGDYWVLTRHADVFAAVRDHETFSSAGGLTVEELRQTLTSAYQLDMQNPIVTVTPLFTVLVLGQVRSPGVYQVPPMTPFLQVVAMAGGFTVSANEANVRLVRGGAVTQINALTAMETGVGLEAYTIQSGDQIVVPEQSGMTWRDVLSIVQLAATLSLIYTRLSR